MLMLLTNTLNMFQATMEEYDLLQKPFHLFNIDEIGLPISPKSCSKVYIDVRHHAMACMQSYLGL